MQEARRIQVQVYNSFPTSPADMALAEIYRIQLIWGFLRSAHFINEASKFMVQYEREALAIAQADLIPSGFHVSFDVNSIFGRITHDSLNWKGNELEEPTYEWWLVIYEKLVHTRPLASC